MPRHLILSVRFPEADTPRPIETRLTAHLKTLRRTRLDAEASSMTAAPEGDDAPPPIPATGTFVKLTDADHAKITRRAKRLHALREAASGLAHLRKEDRDRLAILRDGVDLVRLPTEHCADEIASALHADYPWLAPATEVVWQALRRSVREGWPGLRLPPLVLDGPPGVGKSVWARHLAQALGLPAAVVEATNANASFAVVGCQRGWGSAGPGLLVNTILQRRIGNPIMVIDELEKAGIAEGSAGRSYDLAAALLPLLEPATAERWSCPYYEVAFDMRHVGWIMTVNDAQRLPEALRSRCPPLRLSALTRADLRDFASRQGARRGLSDASIDAILEVIDAYANRAQTPSLRSLIRMLDRAADLESKPQAH